ncbi:hypothetical protein D3C77_610510 [compost metagenome]
MNTGLAAACSINFMPSANVWVCKSCNAVLNLPCSFLIVAVQMAISLRSLVFLRSSCSMVCSTASVFLFWIYLTPKWLSSVLRRRPTGLVDCEICSSNSLRSPAINGAIRACSSGSFFCMLIQLVPNSSGKYRCSFWA